MKTIRTKIAAMLAVGALLPAAIAAEARGPLRVYPENPRYFTDGSGKPVYLTGSHTWQNLQDLGPSNPPPVFDYDRYLELMEKHGHNFMRLWRYELVKWKGWRGTGGGDWFATHHPWKRTGPGLAVDGLPKFDLKQLDPAYFERLRQRVEAAGKRGIYVAIMLFEGICFREAATVWAGHPVHPTNNINGIDGDADGDGKALEVQSFAIPAIVEIHQEYVRRVIDTVNDLDNVLYDISNESLFTPVIVDWQEKMIGFINEHQARKPKRHPVGMTNLVAYGQPPAKELANRALFASSADWVSPGLTIWGPKDPFSIDPPATAGTKVEILDSDHIWSNAAGVWSKEQRTDHAWVWKSFLRGYNPIYMEGMDFSRPEAIMNWLGHNTVAIVSARAAMGYTRAYAQRMNLGAMTPQDALASSGYCLAHAGREYLVYLPNGGEVSVDLTAAAGAMQAEWFNPRLGQPGKGAAVSGGARRTFKAPFDGDAVLYLKAP